MIRLVQRRLIIPRGDTGKFSVPVLKFTEGQNVAVFSIIDLKTRSIVFRKKIDVVGEEFEIEFTHNDTVNLPVGKYVWDIKFYNNPVYADGELINGDEVNSYYGSFSLPECEIKPTGDSLLMSDEAPAAAIAPEQLDILTAILSEVSSAAEEVNDIKSSVEHTVEELNTSIENCATKVSNAVEGNFAALDNEGNLVDSGYNHSNYITQETDPTVPAWAKQPTKPTYTPQEIGALPNNTFIPTNISDLIDDSGHAPLDNPIFITGISLGRVGNVGNNSIATGISATASGNQSAAQGNGITASGANSHAEGANTIASGANSHAEGHTTISSGFNSHAEGYHTQAINFAAHAEGYETLANGDYSHSEGGGTEAHAEFQHVEGKNNIVDDQGNYVIIVGNGTDGANKSNAYVLDWEGNGKFAGNIYVEANEDSTGGSKLAKVSEIPTKVSDLNNDSGFISSYTETDPTVPSWAKAQNKPTYTAQEVGALPDDTFIPLAISQLIDDSGHYVKPDSGIPASDIAVGVIPDISGKADKTDIPTKVSDLENDSGFITQHQNISGKADKVSNAINGNFASLDANGNLIDSGHKHNDYLTQHQDISGKLNSSLKGAANGLAELDENGKVPSSQLPSYVDDVIEYNDISAFPQEGESGKIYVDKNTNITYRWSGSNYVMIGSSLALGETSSTAYRGDRGAAAYAHGVTNKGIAKESGLYKITTNSEGHLIAATAVEKSDITALGVPAQDTTYESKIAVSSGNDISLVTTGEKYIWNNKYDKPINGIPSTDIASGVIPDITGKADKVSNATEGNFIAFDSNGNLADSGHKHSDYITSHQDITGKADKVISAVNGNFASLNENGNLVDSGHKHSDYLTSHQDISGKVDKVANAINGDFASFDANGNLTDSGHKHSDYLTSHQDISGKADKVISATNGNFASLDSNGNLVDSGHKHLDYLTSHQDITGKADKVSSATNGNFAALDNYGNLVDSGHKHSDYLTSHQTIPVTDVQINGTSIVSNNNANIPVASSSVLGVVKLGAGLTVSNGAVVTDAAVSSIKPGTNTYYPIVPAHQHEAVFYGLAKAAGDTTQAASSNTLGTYTDGAKAAIKTMLDVIDPTVTDVQVNGTSILSSGVANIGVASSNNLGVVKVNTVNGIELSSSNTLITVPATTAEIKQSGGTYKIITPKNKEAATFYGLAGAAGDITQASSNNAVGTYTAAAKTAIRDMLGITDGSIYTQIVAETNPVITGEPNMKYVCGEISTLTVTPPSGGTIEIRFVSGTSATILTVQGVNWPGWFDPANLETNTTYDIMITDGVYGSVMLWPV